MRRSDGNTPRKSTGGFITTDPSTGTLLAEISSLAEGVYETRWCVGASTGAIFRLEHTSSSELSTTAIRNEVFVYTVSNGSGEFVFSYKVESGDRFRVRVQSSFSGNAAAIISAEPYL